MDARQLALMAHTASEKAYAPYTGHRAGAALLAKDGTVYTAANIEIAGSSTSCCAARAAFAAALAAGCRGFAALAATSDLPGEAPVLCGVCRQAVAEYCAGDMPVYLVNGAGAVARQTTAAALLPGVPFAKADFAQAQAGVPEMPPAGGAASPARLVQLALEARKQCHAPYSGYHVGVALLGGSGRVYVSGNTETAIRTTALCAERGALFQAVFAGERQFAAIAIVGAKAATPPQKWDYANPCAVCRQALAEFCGDDFPLYLARGEDDYQTWTLGQLLPNAFRIGSYA